MNKYLLILLTLLPLVSLLVLWIENNLKLLIPRKSELVIATSIILTIGHLALAIKYSDVFSLKDFIYLILVFVFGTLAFLTPNKFLLASGSITLCFTVIGYFTKDSLLSDAAALTAISLFTTAVLKGFLYESFIKN